LGSGSVSPVRLMNTKLNPGWGMLKKNVPQSAIFRQGQQSPPGLEGGFPTFIYAEFPAMTPFNTEDLTLFLPDDFTLLGYVGQSQQADGGGFSVQLYDVNRDIWLNDRLINFQNIAGTGSNQLIEREPYDFTAEKAQVLLRVANHSSVANNIQFALYGVVGGAKQ